MAPVFSKPAFCQKYVYERGQWVVCAKQCAASQSCCAGCLETLERQRQKNRVAYKENRESILASKRDSYQENRESVLAKRKQTYQENRESMKAKSKAAYQESRESVLAKRKQAYQENRESVLAKRKVARQEKPPRTDEERAAARSYWVRWGHEIKTGLQKVAEAHPTYEELIECWCKTKTAYCSAPGTKMTPDIKRELRKAGQCFQKSTKDRIFFYDLLCLELKPASDRPLYVAYVCGGSPAQEYAMFFCGEPEIEDLMRWFSWLFREILKNGKSVLFIDSDREHDKLIKALGDEFNVLDSDIHLDVVKLPAGTTRVMMADHAGALHKLLNLCVLGRYATHLDHILLWIRRIMKWNGSHLRAFWPRLVQLMDQAALGNMTLDGEGDEAINIVQGFDDHFNHCDEERAFADNYTGGPWELWELQNQFPPPQLLCYWPLPPPDRYPEVDLGRLAGEVARCLDLPNGESEKPPVPAVPAVPPVPAVPDVTDSRPEARYPTPEPQVPVHTEATLLKALKTLKARWPQEPGRVLEFLEAYLSSD